MRRLTLDDLYRLATPADPRLSPAGDAVAYTLTTADRETDANRTEIWLAAPGRAPRKLADGTAPRWSPDGRTLAFLRPVDGAAQLHLLPMDGGEATVLTKAPLGAGAAVWSPDGTRIAFSGPSGDLDPHAPVVADRLDYKADGTGLLRGLTAQLFVVDVATGASARVTSGDFHAGEPSWEPGGGRLTFVSSMAPDRDLVVGGAVYAVAVPPVRQGGEEPGDAKAEGGDARTEGREEPGDARAEGGDAQTEGRELPEPECLTGPELIAMAAWWLGERLVVAGLRGGPSGHVRLFDEHGEIETGLDRNVMVGGPGYPGAPPRLRGEELLFCARDRGRTHLYGLADGKAAKLLDGDQTISGVSVAGQSIAYVASTPLSSGDVYLDGERLTDYALEGVELFKARTRTFTAPDGTQVEGFVLRDPASAGRSPLLLDIHGGPHNAWAPDFDGVHLYHQVLAAQGWTVLTLNVRASDGYGEEFYTAALGGWGLADQDDFLSAVDELVADGIADPDRLAVTGYSYGGYMTCWLTGQTGRFKAAIPGGVVTDLTSMSGTSDAGYYLKTYELLGDLVRQSPFTHVAKVTTPTLILQGENDDRCPVGQAEQWFAALREQGVPARLVRYPGGSHLFILNGRPSHRFDYNERIVQWLEQWVTGSQS
ncbi:S9 family peptidase [Nonomuraea soli]|uniref:Acyl-peptide hydrolase n=1 Tax=Nonomuraea soli TaxID=1032476 RepID=A0A7W0CS19_9ACTN|nr:S9 family peptidase [Nonomuraea soli]MBA2896135.1 dipeptidyl aminopeptidase/acylaminoacyl peptidase [Nonomuraea soli]